MSMKFHLIRSHELIIMFSHNMAPFQVQAVDSIRIWLERISFLLLRMGMQENGWAFSLYSCGFNEVKIATRQNVFHLTAN